MHKSFDLDIDACRTKVMVQAGKALFTAQKFDFDLRFVLLVGKEVGVLTVADSELDSILTYKTKKGTGYFKGLVLGDVGISDEKKEALDKSVCSRNYIAHELFAYKAEKMATDLPAFVTAFSEEVRQHVEILVNGQRVLRDLGDALASRSVAFMNLYASEKARINSLLLERDVALGEMK